MPDAPGLKRRSRKGEDAWYWVAAAASRKSAGYPIKTVRLHCDSDADRAAECRHLTAQLLEWINAGDPEPVYEGTILSLIRLYQHLPESPYAGVQENTRRDYDGRLRILERAVGDRAINRLTAVDFTKWYRVFRTPAKEGGPERIRTAHGLMVMVRMLISFGVSMRYPGCLETQAVLKAMEFEGPKRRTKALTFSQAEKIVDLALAAGRRSLALGQALQFELAMRQVDVIGKWTTATKDDVGGIVDKGYRWGGGLVWSDISDRLTISKETTKTAATGEWDLNQCPLVLKALAAYAPADRRPGPMVVSEASGFPYDLYDYARTWRKFANEAGVPTSVWNRDSRAGGITEAWDAGAEVQDIQRMATHVDPAMTRRYARNSLASSQRVQALRVASRIKDTANG